MQQPAPGRHLTSCGDQAAGSRSKGRELHMNAKLGKAGLGMKGRWSTLFVAVALTSAIYLLSCSSAFALYQQVGIFSGTVAGPAEPGVFPEEVQLGGVSGLA